MPAFFGDMPQTYSFIKISAAKKRLRSLRREAQQYAT
jgi:hypothetical protein